MAEFWHPTVPATAPTGEEVITTGEIPALSA
jgi:hypothetical protein